MCTCHDLLWTYASERSEQDPAEVRRSAFGRLLRHHLDHPGEEVTTALVERAATGGFDTEAWALAQALEVELTRRGDWEQIAALGQTAITVAERFADSRTLAESHRILGQAQFRLGDLNDAEAVLRRSLALFQEVEDPASAAAVLMLLARILSRLGRHADALQHAGDALTFYAMTDS